MTARLDHPTTSSNSGSGPRERDKGGDGAAPPSQALDIDTATTGDSALTSRTARPSIPNRESVPSPCPWLWERLKSEWNEAQLAHEAHRRGEDWLNDECFLYEAGKYDRPLRRLGKRDKSGTFCEAEGKQIPFDEPLREVGGELVPAQRSPTPSIEAPHPSPSHPPSPISSPAQPPQNQSALPPSSGRVGVGSPRRGLGGEAKSKSSPLRKEVPKEKPAARRVSTGRRGFVPLL